MHSVEFWNSQSSYNSRSDFNKYEAKKNCSLWFVHLTRNFRRSGLDKSFQLQVYQTFFDKVEFTEP